MSSAESPKVLIVGAGPSGLIAALTLIRNGIPVRIIEKSITPRIGQRGAGVMARTFEVFEALGFLEEAMKYTISVPKMRIYKPGSSTEVVKEYFLHHVVDPTPDRPYINPRLLGQESLDKVLREILEKLGCHIELGMGLVGFEQDDEKVKVKLQRASGGEEEEASYDYMIGADGARGVVRKQLGLTFVGETTEQKMAVGEFMVEGGLENDIWHRWGEPGTYMLMIRPTDQPGLFTFVTGGRLLPNPDDIVQSETVLKNYIKERLAGRDDVKIGDIKWMGTYTINIRMVDSFKKGRVFVTGDAAHIHSPTGAQGMNTGIQDSYNIGWKLALVQKGVAPPALLETVTEERVPVVAEMLELTTTLLKRTILSDADRNRPEAVNQYGVNYRLSSIVLDDGSDLKEARKISPYGGGDAKIVYAGDRAPDAPGLIKIGGTQEPTRLFKLLGPSHHTVLVFADKAEGVFQASSNIFKKYPSDLVRFVVIHTAGKAVQANGPTETFEDSQGHAYNAYKNSQNVSGVFIIRPDGYVGGRFESTDKVEAYFKGIFGDHF
ncbi:FAD binding domain-containing protein [Crepidotus variabilis]|uniref:FAD binding domain-containing protein n=1 Tax=Crepidotus variabilis TaxID=179855 RepID=A0A9P6E9I8_9AGAR|nr:FAD binding domain-containing protein [Crepidotus variabilis]